MCFDYDYWDFNNHTDQHVRLTPLYTSNDGIERVVPRHGWQQTEFEMAPGSTLTINLETGDFPFDRVLVEAAHGAPWTIPVERKPVDIVATGLPATPAQSAAKREPKLQRLKLYLVAAAIPLLWTLPILFVTEQLRRRRRVPNA